MCGEYAAHVHKNIIHETVNLIRSGHERATIEMSEEVISSALRSRPVIQHIAKVINTLKVDKVMIWHKLWLEAYTKKRDGPLYFWQSPPFPWERVGKEILACGLCHMIIKRFGGSFGVGHRLISWASVLAFTGFCW